MVFAKYIDIVHFLVHSPAVLQCIVQKRAFCMIQTIQFQIQICNVRHYDQRVFLWILCIDGFGQISEAYRSLHFAMGRVRKGPEIGGFGDHNETVKKQSKRSIQDIV